MASGRRISGIFVPISLDTSSIKADMERLRNELDRAGASMMQSFGGSVESSKLARGFGDAVKAVGQLRDAVRAFDALKPMGSFSQSLQTISPELRKLGQELGLTMKAQQDLLYRMANNQAINQEVQALRILERTLGTTREETLRLAQSYGLAVSEMGQNRYLGNQTDQIKKLTEEYNKLARLSGQSASAEGLKKFLDTAKIREAVDAFKKLNPSLEMTRQHYEQIARAAGVAASQVEEFIRAQQQGEGGRGLMGIFSTRNLSGALQSAISAAGVVTGAVGLVEFAKAAVDASLKMDNLTKAFESIYNSSSRANSQLEFIRKTADKLGLSFVEVAEGAKGLFASFQGTVLEKDTNRIFTAFSNMGAALKLTGDQMNGVYLAISQMASKGKVSAEELRLQLAERMPGAVTLFAQSIGVSTRELDKMLRDGAVGLDHLAKFADAVQEKYQAGAAAASTGLQAELNRVSTAWFDLKRAFVDSDALAEGVRGIGKAMRYLADNADGISRAVLIFGKFIALTAGIYAASKAVMVLVGAIKALTAAGGVTGALTKFVGLIRAFPHPVLAAAAGVSALVVALGEMRTSMSEGEKVLAEYGKGFESVWEGADKFGKSLEELSEKQKQIEFDRLNNQAQKAADKLKAVFMPENFELPSNILDDEVEAVFESLNTSTETAVSRYFDKLRTTMLGEDLHKLIDDAQKVATDLGKRMQEGIASKLNSEELGKIWSDAQTSLQNIYNSMQTFGADEEASFAFAKLINSLKGLTAEAIKSRKEIEEFTGTAKADLDDLSEKSVTAFEAIKKLTQGTEIGKSEKFTADLNAVTDQLLILYQNSEEAQRGLEDLDYTVSTAHESFLKLQGPIEQFQDSLPRVAEYAIQNGVSFDRMAASLEEARIKAGDTADEIARLKAMLQAAFNVEIGNVITKELQKLDLQIAQVGAKVKDTTAFGILKKVVTDAADQEKLFTAITTKDMKTLGEFATKYGAKIEDFQSVLDKSDLYGSKMATKRGGGGSRSRRSGVSTAAKQAQKDLSDLEKTIESTQKKIGALQSKIEADPSIKYWADVTAELKTIDELIAKQGNSHAEQTKQLAELRNQYALLAEERAAQMKEEEDRQKRIQAANMMGNGYGQLGEVNMLAPARVQIQALKAMYDENMRDYQKLCDDKIITEQEFVDAVDAMQQELAIKTAQANGSMLASFANAFQQAQQNLADWRDQVADIMVDAVGTMSDALADFTVKGMQNAEDLQAAFKDLVDSMIQDLARLFMRMMIMSAMNSLFASFFGGAGNPGAPNGTNISSNPLFVGPVKPYAFGGVVAGGNISRFSGHVVAGPTLFSGSSIKAYAKGGNVMGEKGPEAIMPLTRRSDGKLGVDATVGSSNFELNQQVNVNIINRTDDKITSSQSRDDNGNLELQIMVEKMVGDAMTRTGSSPFRSLRNVWQGSPALAQRG